MKPRCSAAILLARASCQHSRRFMATIILEASSIRLSRAWKRCHADKAMKWIPRRRLGKMSRKTRRTLNLLLNRSSQSLITRHTPYHRESRIPPSLHVLIFCSGCSERYARISRKQCEFDCSFLRCAVPQSTKESKFGRMLSSQL